MATFLEKFKGLSIHQVSKIVKIREERQDCTYIFVNTAIHHVLISPSVGHFKDESLAFAFASQNELITESGSSIVWFLDPAQLTCSTNAGGK
ncbi:hypothetical protein DSO57_1018200 [Entomophthora muscae]|uniref:Uncharacterized protein n=1 Tax=Entomophthora muscae TaxID=34485 RepID=A0ACC2S6J8_9FUNG|nr:hypothetical protein DSO57_1018200 [Entomophthora muscae]